MNESQKDLDVEEYQIVATLDNRTSAICQSLDLKHFPMNEYKEGSTAPPFHPHCRSVTVPYFDDEFTKDEMRAARDEKGKTYYVPADMSYDEWKNCFTVSESNMLLKKSKKNDKMIIFDSISDLIYPITDESINNVGYIKIPILSDKTNKIIYEQRKELLKELQKQPVGIEGSIIINLENLSINKIHLGDYGQTKIDDLDNFYFAIHNHPDNGCLSPGDLVGFCKRHYMYGLEAIGNSGYNNSIIIKTNNCKVDEYYDYINMKTKEFFSNNPNLDVEKDYDLIVDFSNKLLNEGEKYGFEIIKK